MKTILQLIPVIIPVSSGDSKPLTKEEIALLISIFILLNIIALMCLVIYLYRNKTNNIMYNLNQIMMEYNVDFFTYFILLISVIVDILVIFFYIAYKLAHLFI